MKGSGLVRYSGDCYQLHKGLLPIQTSTLGCYRMNSYSYVIYNKRIHESLDGTDMLRRRYSRKRFRCLSTAVNPLRSRHSDEGQLVAMAHDGSQWFQEDLSLCLPNRQSVILFLSGGG